MPVEPVPTPLPPMAQPFSWAVKANGMLYTAHGPVDAAGNIVGDDVEAQARLTFGNLDIAARAAGTGLHNVAQVLIYLASASDIAAVDRVYREFFQPPYPNRSTVGGLEFAHPAMRIEIVAYVALDPVTAGDRGGA